MPLFDMPAQWGVGGVGHICACRGGGATCPDVTDPPPPGMFTPNSR